MLAAGSIVLFRYELLVSFLTLVAWCAWRHRLAPLRRGSAGGGHLEQALSAPACPALCPPAAGRDVRRQCQGGRQRAGARSSLVFCCSSGWAETRSRGFSGVVRFHENKPVGLESTPATLAMAFDAIRGAWPSHSVNEYSIHGLRLPPLCAG